MRLKHWRIISEEKWFSLTEAILTFLKSQGVENSHFSSTSLIIDLNWLIKRHKITVSEVNTIKAAREKNSNLSTVTSQWLHREETPHFLQYVGRYFQNEHKSGAAMPNAFLYFWPHVQNHTPRLICSNRSHVFLPLFIFTAPCLSPELSGRFPAQTFPRRASAVAERFRRARWVWALCRCTLSRPPLRRSPVHNTNIHLAIKSIRDGGFSRMKHLLQMLLFFCDLQHKSTLSDNINIMEGFNLFRLFIYLKCKHILEGLGLLTVR